MYYAPWDRASQEARSAVYSVAASELGGALELHYKWSLCDLVSSSCLNSFAGQGRVAPCVRVLPADGPAGGRRQLLVPRLRLRQGVRQQIAGHAFPRSHLLPGEAQRCAVPGGPHGREDYQVLV